MLCLSFLTYVMGTSQWRPCSDSVSLAQSLAQRRCSSCYYYYLTTITHPGTMLRVCIHLSQTVWETRTCTLPTSASVPRTLTWLLSSLLPLPDWLMVPSTRTSRPTQPHGRLTLCIPLRLAVCQGMWGRTATKMCCHVSWGLPEGVGRALHTSPPHGSPVHPTMLPVYSQILASGCISPEQLTSAPRWDPCWVCSNPAGFHPGVCQGQSTFLTSPPADDQTRVILSLLQEEGHGDYINGNFIRVRLGVREGADMVGVMARSQWWT